MGYEFSFDLSSILLEKELGSKYLAKATTPADYHKLLESFRRADIAFVEERPFSIKVTGFIDTFKAAVVTATHYSIDEDFEFSTWYQNAQLAYLKMTEIARTTHFSLLQSLHQAQQKRVAQLESHYKQLTALAKEVALPIEKLPSLSFKPQVEHLIEVNNQLFREITLCAREKVAEYNKVGAQALVLATAMASLEHQAPEVMKEAQDAYQAHNQKEISRSSPQLASSVPRYSFIDPTKKFPLFEDFPAMSQVQKTLCKQNHATINSQHLKDLQKKIQSLQDISHQAHQEQNFWKEWLMTLEHLSNDIYAKIIKLIKDSSHNSGFAKDLTKSVQDIVEGKPLSDKDYLIHKIKSSDLPLLDTIYDKSLAILERETLLAQLVIVTDKSAIARPIKTTSPNLIAPVLLHAAWSGTTAMLEILLKKAADINAVGHCYEQGAITLGGQLTALHLAVLQDDIKKVTCLIAQGANVNATSRTGCTPVYGVKSSWVLQLLIKAGAKVDITNAQGQSPLHMAVSERRVQVIVDLLKQKDINVNQVDKFGNTPLHIAAASKFPEESSYHYSFSLGKTIRMQQKKDNLEIIKLLAEAKASGEYSNRAGYTLLQLACGIGEVDLFADLQYSGQKMDYDHTKNKLHLLNKYGFDWDKSHEVIINFDKRAINCQNLTKNLTPIIIEAIFKHDNIITQTAARLGLKRDETNSKEILLTIYEALITEKCSIFIEITVPLTPIEEAYYILRGMPEQLVAQVKEWEKAKEEWVEVTYDEEITPKSSCIIN